MKYVYGRCGREIRRRGVSFGLKYNRDYKCFHISSKICYTLSVLDVNSIKGAGPTLVQKMEVTPMQD